MDKRTPFTNYLIPIAILLGILLIVLFARTALENSYELLPADFSQDLKPVKYQDWKKITSKENYFKALFPISPQHATKSVKIKGSQQSSVYDVYVSEQKNGSVLMVRVVTYPKDYTFTNKNKLIKSPLDEMMSSSDKNVLRKVENQTFHGFQSVSFSIQNPKTRMDGISFLVANKLYLLSYIANLEDYIAGEFNQFVNSFDLLNNPAAKPIDTTQEAEKLLDQ